MSRSDDWSHSQKVHKYSKIDKKEQPEKCEKLREELPRSEKHKKKIKKLYKNETEIWMKSGVVKQQKSNFLQNHQKNNLSLA